MREPRQHRSPRILRTAVLTALALAGVAALVLALSRTSDTPGRVAAEEPPVRDARDAPSAADAPETAPSEAGEPAPEPAPPRRETPRDAPADEIFAGSPSLVGHLEDAAAPDRSAQVGTRPALHAAPGAVPELPDFEEEMPPLMLAGGEDASRAVLATPSVGRGLGEPIPQAPPRPQPEAGPAPDLFGELAPRP